MQGGIMPTTQLPQAPTFGLWYDYRNPAAWRKPAGELYRHSIDQAVWAEQLGFGSVWLSEHHFADDDYASPTPDDGRHTGCAHIAHAHRHQHHRRRPAQP